MQELKNEVTVKLASMGMDLTSCSGDRNDAPIDFRFLDLSLRAADDPEVGLCSFVQGVRVCPGARMPLPALYKRKKKKKWRLASQADPKNNLEEDETGRPARLEEELRLSHRTLRQGFRGVGGPDSKGTNHQAHGGGCKKSVPELGDRVPRGQQEGQTLRRSVSTLPFRWYPRSLSDHQNQDQGPGAITSCVRPQTRDARESLSG